MKSVKSRKTFQIAVFASGRGSNAQALIDHFARHPHICISLIVCNKPDAGVLDIAREENIPSLVIERERFVSTGYVEELQRAQIDFIVLAGFLWKVPPILIRAYPNKIINIHPALLPKYGGKGMYGQRVHEAVVAAKEKASGITIHYVDEIYDHGTVIFQANCEVDDTDTWETVAKKVQALEHLHFAEQIEKLLKPHFNA